jgi:RNA polymerase sigma-70 factor, ECF subfamily
MNEQEVRKALTLIAGGDEKAFASVFRHFSSRVYRFSLSHLRDTGKAEDIVSQTMFDLWRKAGDFRGDSAFSTWLLGIARNHILMSYRYQARHDQEVYTDDIETVVESHPQQELSALDVFSSKARAEELQLCIDKLTPEHREAIHLTFFEDLPLEQVARIMTIPSGTVKSRLFHARKKLGDCLNCIGQKMPKMNLKKSSGE